jgi:hypothetical protein
MATIGLTGQTKVGKLKQAFFDEFGLTLRIYDGRSFAEDDATLAQIVTNQGRVGDLSVAKNMKVGNLEKKFREDFELRCMPGKDAERRTWCWSVPWRKY